MKHRSNFNWKQFLRSVAVIAIPVALQNLLTTTASMVDTMMIAPLGETAVGAVLPRLHSVQSPAPEY